MFITFMSVLSISFNQFHCFRQLAS